MRNWPLYAYDAEADAMQRWNTVSSLVEDELQAGHISPLFDANGKKATEVVAPASQMSGSNRTDRT